MDPDTIYVTAEAVKVVPGHYPQQTYASSSTQATAPLISSGINEGRTTTCNSSNLIV